MAPNRSKNTSSGLGKALINRKAKDAFRPKESQLYVLDEANPLNSVTHERDLDEFLANAALADQDFTTERSKIRLISGPGVAPSAVNPWLLSEAEEKKAERKHLTLQEGLKIPRRPAWTRTTTRQELEKQEREAFLDWRRGLAHLAEDNNLLLTPFERNIQLWRQLWRVLERSHLIVQIVDARNPLTFRSVDLDHYVQEVGSDDTAEDTTVPGKGKRKSLLLINKSDLLTIEQRRAWADYFDKEGISYAFFSAANATAAQEQAEKQRKREAGEWESDEDDEDYEDAGDEDQDEEDEDEEEAEDDDEDDDDQLTNDGAITKALEKIELGGKPAAAEVQEEDEGEEDEGEEDEGEEAEESVKAPAAPVAEPEEPEDPRTRILDVTELEDLFISSAPPLSDFATARDPDPKKMMIGLVGYPNVGKSSTINSLLGAKKVSVSSTPGKTKHFQTLVLSDEITLCDCPGLVFPQFALTQADMICDGVLPIDQMREYSAPVDLLCRRIPREILEGTYGIRIDVQDVEDGGTGKVGWEQFLSAYAIARGMTRSTFGMPDTSRASRYILKDYVNAKLLYAHPPPGWDSDEFMSTSRAKTLAALEEAYASGAKKRAPETHVSSKSDTYVAPAGQVAGQVAAEEIDAPAERALTSAQIRKNAATSAGYSGRKKAEALENAFFEDSGPAPRPVVKGRSQGPAAEHEGGHYGFSRNTMYPHQRRLGPDGMPIIDQGTVQVRNNGKKHFKKKVGKQRSGRGYD